MNGLADYVDFFPCPYDQIVDAFNSIPAIPQPFDTVGDCDCGCMGGCGGLSGLTDGPGLLGTGFFAGGFDPSTWGFGEWTIVAGLAALVFWPKGRSAPRYQQPQRKYSAGTGNKRS